MGVGTRMGRGRAEIQSYSRPSYLHFCLPCLSVYHLPLLYHMGFLIPACTPGSQHSSVARAQACLTLGLSCVSAHTSPGMPPFLGPQGRQQLMGH